MKKTHTLPNGTVIVIHHVHQIYPIVDHYFERQGVKVTTYTFYIDEYPAVFDTEAEAKVARQSLINAIEGA